VWCVVCGVWCVVCGVWCVVCGVWCVVCGVWCVVCGVCVVLVYMCSMWFVMWCGMCDIGLGMWVCGYVGVRVSVMCETSCCERKEFIYYIKTTKTTNKINNINI
jgi:hypothetical protein